MLKGRIPAVKNASLYHTLGACPAPRAEIAAQWDEAVTRESLTVLFAQFQAIEGPGRGQREADCDRSISAMASWLDSSRTT